MKNKDKYDLRNLYFKKVKANDFRLIYLTIVLENGKQIATITGSAMSDILDWLERDE